MSPPGSRPRARRRSPQFLRHVHAMLLEALHEETPGSRDVLKERVELHAQRRCQCTIWLGPITFEASSQRAPGPDGQAAAAFVEEAPEQWIGLRRFGHLPG